VVDKKELEGDCIISSLMTCKVLLTGYYSDEQIKKNEMGRECGRCWRQERYIQGFSGEI
jgi:hypothetical protein